MSKLLGVISLLWCFNDDGFLSCEPSSSQYYQFASLDANKLLKTVSKGKKHIIITNEFKLLHATLLFLLLRLNSHGDNAEIMNDEMAKTRLTASQNMP